LNKSGEKCTINSANVRTITSQTPVACFRPFAIEKKHVDNGLEIPVQIRLNPNMRRKQALVTMATSYLYALNLMIIYGVHLGTGGMKIVLHLFIVNAPSYLFMAYLHYEPPGGVFTRIFGFGSLQEH